MIHNVNDICVEIDGKIFPAANIQVLAGYPMIRWAEDHQTNYGLYFDVMFENGVVASVDQEATRIENGEWDSMCEATPDVLDHFVVEITRMQDGYKEVIHAYHCVGEEHLADVLSKEMKINEVPNLGALFWPKIPVTP